METLTLVRTARTEVCTTGVFYLNGVWMAHTLEPTWRDLTREAKVPGRTAIPEGTYRLVLSPSARFGRRMPYLLDVPGFSGVMIHPGNCVTDTKGCILVGRRGRTDTLTNSRSVFAQLYARLLEVVQAGSMLEIKVC